MKRLYPLSLMYWGVLKGQAHVNIIQEIVFILLHTKENYKGKKGHLPHFIGGNRSVIFLGRSVHVRFSYT